MQDPYTYVCAACRAETENEFPADLQSQMSRWREQELHDRVIHKALSRPMKLKAIKEVHTLLAGLPPEPPANVEVRRKATFAASPTGDRAGRSDYAQPVSDLSIPVDGATSEETSYTTLLFDYRSVRNYW
jgi:hypothetical protein